MILTIEGAHGEGGGQILRSALTLAAITGRTVQLHAIRAGRATPGLRPQHLTAVRALARLCDAEVAGDSLGSQQLTFAPRCTARPGDYTFDVTEVARSGSAGSVTLILQTVLLPLALAPGPATLTLRGGTDVPGSPPSRYIEQVYLPALQQLGVQARCITKDWGFYPRGGGELQVTIEGGARLRGLTLTAPGALTHVEGEAYVAMLPSHIPQRMTNRARGLLKRAGFDVPVRLTPLHVTARNPAAAIFLVLRYTDIRAGFHQRGRKGQPSEEVAALACERLLAHHRSGAALDPHLADQLVLPLLLAEEPSQVTVSEVTSHLRTNVWVAQQFDLRAVTLRGEAGAPGQLEIA